MKKSCFIATLFIIAFICAASQKAQALNVQSSHPNIGQTGTFNIFGSRTLPSLNFNLGIATQFEKDPLEFRNFSTGTQVRHIVDWMETTDVLAEFGAANWATVGLDIPFSFVRYALPSNMNINENKASLGDITVYGKFAVLHPDKYPVGFAIMPFVSAPTGSTSHFTGDNSADLGVKLIADKEFDRGYLGLNLGYKAHMRNDVVEIVGSTGRIMVDDEFLFGLGGGVDIIKKRLRVFTEFMGATAAAHFAQNEQTSPMEINGGVQISAMENNAMKITVGGGGGLNGGYSAPKYRIFAGLSYLWPVKQTEKQVKIEPMKEEIIETITLVGVHFAFDKYDILPDAAHILDENFARLQKYHNGERFRVIGHTDSRGSDAYNQVLSEKRAKVVVDYLVKKGIEPVRMLWEGRGKREPVAPNNSERNMWLNRRAMVIQVLK